MAENKNKIVGYKNIFGFVLPDWVDEATIKMIVTFLLSSAVMLFVLIFVIWPKFSEVSDLRSGLATKEGQLESLKNSKGGFDRLNEQVPETTQNLILEAIPQVYSPESAVYVLRSISNTTGVSIVSYSLPAGTLFEVEKTNTKGGGGTDTGIVNFVSYPIKLSVTAPVASLLAFIDKVETSLPFGVVSDLGMQEVGRLSKSVAVDKSIRMELEIRYFQTVLKKVDIGKIQPFSEGDLAWADKIKDFSRFNQAGTGVFESSVATNSAGTLFGF